MSDLKGRSGRPAPAGGGRLDELPDAAPSQRDQALGWSRLVHALLDQALDQTEKQVFTMHYGDGLPLHVITRLLGLSNRSGAKAYINKARRKLRRAARLWKARQQILDS